MRNIHVFHLEVAAAGHINGVSRCIRTLVDSFANSKRIKVTWIRFTYNIVPHTHKEKHDGYQIIHFPLSSELKEIWGHADEKVSFYQEVLSLIQKVTDKSCQHIVQIHTMNLIEVGLYLRKNSDFKVISTIHCIPWKSLYNSNIKSFNRLYEDYYIAKELHNPDNYLCGEYERLTYEESDALVCVTNCAKEFICRICSEAGKKITVIPNGLKDTHYESAEDKDAISCLFVGNASPSKGLDFLLQSLCLVQPKHGIRLIVAGNYAEGQIRAIRKKYPFLEITFCGALSWCKLAQIYSKCTIGVIPSLQEQCSYAAIEMMMSGLPIISSCADGLGEMFTHAYNALIVPIRFSHTAGLSLDTVKMSNSICALIADPCLRLRLGGNARKTYLRKHKDSVMAHSYTRLYESLYM